MKTIEISDEDYEVLMELSKELQTQDNNGQAFPYFWTPSSLKEEYNVNDEGEFTKIYYDTDTYSPKEFADSRQEIYEEFLKSKGYTDEEIGEKLLGKYEEISYIPELEDEWLEFLEDKLRRTDFRVYTVDLQRKNEENISLFHSDVKSFCEFNSHHLGKNPAPFSHTIWRMPKMNSLVQVIMRLNKQPKDIVNHEALRYI